jgi:hypothetical protein
MKCEGGTLEYTQNTEINIRNSKSMRSHYGRSWDATTNALNDETRVT